MTQPNTSIVDSVRAFYEQTATVAATEMPDTTWPAFDDLTADQARLWTLALAAATEVAVRMGDAVLSIDEPTP